MALRKASAYTKKYARPFTRKSKKKAKSYIKAVPPQKIVKFNMGKLREFEDGKFKVILRVKTNEKIQIRDNALEAARQTIHKHLEKNLQGQFFFSVRKFPHHILRENKVLTGAGADRMQSGMKHSYGKAMGRAAFAKKGEDILILAVSGEKATKIAREAIRKTKPKLPFKVHVETEYKK